MMSTWEFYYERNAIHIRWELGMCTRDYFMDNNTHLCARYQILESILARQVQLREYYCRQWSSLRDSLDYVRKNKNSRSINTLVRTKTEKELVKMLRETNRIIRQVIDIGEVYYNEHLALRWFEAALVHAVNTPDGPTELVCRVFEKLEERTGISRGDRISWFEGKKVITISKQVKVSGEGEGKFRMQHRERVVWDCGFNCRYDGVEKAHLHPSERIYSCEGCDVRLIKIAEDLERHRGDMRAYFDCMVTGDMPEGECICDQEQKKNDEDEEEGEEDSNYEPSNASSAQNEEEDVKIEEGDEEDQLGEHELQYWSLVELCAGQESAELKDENMDMDAPYEQEDGGEGSNCGCLNCS